MDVVKPNRIKTVLAKTKINRANSWHNNLAKSPQRFKNDVPILARI